MYPRNAASPPPIGIGVVVQISDGAVQTTGVSARVKTGTGSWGAAANTPTCDATSGVWEYTPSQAETNAESFQVAIYKTGCIPTQQTIVTTASSTAGKVDVSHVAGTAQTAGDLKATLTDMSGSGFLSSTDSLEAIRNRGDLAWTTGAGIAATAAYAPSGAPVVTTGSVSSGAYTDLASVDGTNLVVDEASTTNPGMDFYIPCMTAAGKKGVAVKLWGYYSGNASHFLRVQASVDGSTTSFEDIGTMANGTSITPFTFSLSPQHIKADGTFNLRFLHNAVAGINTHKLYLDKVIVETVDAQQSVILADGAHGGLNSSIALGSGGLTILGNIIPTRTQTRSDNLVLRQFLAERMYECGSWDGGFAGDPITVTFSGTLDPSNGYIYLTAWDCLMGDSRTYLGGMDGAGPFVKESGWTATKDNTSLGLEIGYVTVAGTLTITVKSGASYFGTTPRTITIDIPVISNENAFFPLNTGELIMYGTTGAVTPGLDAAGMRAAIGMASADMDTQLSGIAADAATAAAITPLDAPGIRLAIGMAAGDLDTQLAGIAADAATAASGGLDPAVLAVLLESAGFAKQSTLEEIIAAGVALANPVGVGSASTKLVSTMFDSIRLALRDDKAKQYTDALLVEHYNRAVDEVMFVILQLGSSIGMGQMTFVGDDTNQIFALPSDFRAFVPKAVRPRSPFDATSNYSHGAPLSQVAPLDKSIVILSTTVSQPTAFEIFTDGEYQYLRFNCIPQSGYRIDAMYWKTAPTVTVATISSTYTPFLGLLDSVIQRTIEQYCREGLEFTIEARAKWRERAEADITMLLGLRFLQVYEADPSSWVGLP